MAGIPQHPHGAAKKAAPASREAQPPEFTTQPPTPTESIHHEVHDVKRKVSHQGTFFDRCPSQTPVPRCPRPRHGRAANEGWWRHGDSNPGPLACHARRHAPIYHAEKPEKPKERGHLWHLRPAGYPLQGYSVIGGSVRKSAAVGGYPVVIRQTGNGRFFVFCLTPPSSRRRVVVIEGRAERACRPRLSDNLASAAWDRSSVMWTRPGAVGS